MDFTKILQTAQKNNGGRNGSNFYKTKFEPPKKEAKSKELSENIKKFLAKKEEEEKRKAQEARRKRDELLAKRDQKATNKIKKMLKVIKSANKSVLEEAVDNVNTAVTMHGPDQPDEDDYGYVSQEAAAFYSKMMEKYKNIPDEEKFSSKKGLVNGDLSSTKDRVRAAILKQQEEELLPHKRKKRSRNDDSSARDEEVYDDKKDNYNDKKDEKPKPKRPMPPPLDFTELLKIAEKKQFEPVVIETKKPESSEEPERLMTKKQKREYEEMRAFQEAKLRREKERESGSSRKSSNVDSKAKSAPTSKPTGISSMRIPKIGDKSSNSPKPEEKKVKSECLPKSSIKRDDVNKSDKNKILMNKNNNQSSNGLDKNKTIPTNSNIKSQSLKRPMEQSESRNIPSKMLKTEKYVSDQRKSLSNNENRPKPSGSLQNKVSSDRLSSSVPSKVKSDGLNQRSMSSNDRSQSSNGIVDKKMEKRPDDVRKSNVINKDIKSNEINKPKMLPQSSSAKPGMVKKPADLNNRDKQINGNSSQSNLQKSRPLSSNQVQKTRQFPPNDIQKPRQFPPPDMQRSRQFPPNDVKRKEMMMKREKLKKRRILDDDDSEYDSSLEDFIDDGPEDAGDVSSYIKEIFGYDKSRYKDFDDDDRNMESNFSQVMREEYISKKIGLMEDLEDMKMEALEKKKKMMMKQRKK